MAAVIVLGCGVTACSVSVPDGRQVPAMSTDADMAAQIATAQAKSQPQPKASPKPVRALPDPVPKVEQTPPRPQPTYSPLVQAALAQARLQSDHTLVVPSDLAQKPRVSGSHLGLRRASQERPREVSPSASPSPRSKPVTKKSQSQGLRPGLLQTGRASWYGDKFHGRQTANGERYNMNAMTAAHKTLPFGTEVCVRSLVSGHEVLVRINDRGPYAGNRIIDVSRGAAEKLGMIRLGLKEVALWIPSEEGGECGDGSAEITGLRTRNSR